MWSVTLIGVILLVVGAYIIISLFENPIAMWAGVIMAIIGLITLAVAAVLS